MFVTKEEFKNLNVKEVFESGKNFIKITDGRHAIYWVNDRYVVLDHKKEICTRKKHTRNISKEN
ncbi:hypothetical protein MHBAU10_10070 [Staphylococcus aureus]